MLSLVAGPTDIVPADSMETVVQVASGAYSRGFWEDAHGLWFIADTGSTHAGDLYAVHFTGKAVRVGPGSRNGSGVGALAQAPDDVQTQVMGDVSGNWWKTRLPSTAQLGALYVNAPGDVVLADRKLRFAPGLSAHILGVAYGSVFSGAEFSFASPPAGSGGVGALFDAGVVGGHRLLWCLDVGNGKLMQYDATAKAEGSAARTSLGSAVRLAGYSVKWGLFVAVRRDTTRTPNVDQLYVYANEPVAASIAAPSFSTTPTRGKVSTLSSRLLGDLGEPCVGRNVTFAVSTGSLELATVATDAQGYASTRWFGPTDGAPSGATASATLME